MGNLMVTNPETGEVADVEYRISGRYSRATLYDPPEYPEVEFIDLPDWALDIDGLEQEVLEQEADDAASYYDEDPDDYMPDDYDDYDGDCFDQRY